MKRIMCILIALVAISLVADPDFQWHYYGTFNIVIPSGVTIVQAKIVDESGDTYLDVTVLPLQIDIIRDFPSSMDNLEVYLSNGEIRIYTLIQTDETQPPPNGVPPCCNQIRLSLSGSQPSIPYDPTIPHYD